MVNEEINFGKNGEFPERQKLLKNTLKIIEKGLLKVLIFKEERALDEPDHQSKTGRFISATASGTETVLTSLHDVLEARNSDKFRQLFSQNIDAVSLESIDVSQYTIDHIEDSLSFVTDEKSGKMERQLYADLKRNDARILWYIEKFSEFGIVFENEEAIFEELKLLCDWDSLLEQWLQQQLFMISKNYKAKKRESIGNIIDGLQHKHQ